MTFDESKQSSEVVIDDVIWTCLMRCELRTDPSVKARFVAKHGENVAWVGFAARPLSTWLDREREGTALPVVCGDP